MLRLGLVSAILPELTTEEVIAYAAKVGFSSAELMCWPHGPAERRYAGVTHLDVDRMSDSVVHQLQAALNKYGITISGLGYYPNPLDPDSARSAYHVEHIMKIIRAAERVSRWAKSRSGAKASSESIDATMTQSSPFRFTGA